MYSYDDRIRAVRLYIQYDKSAAAVIQELGYPERKTLRYWYKEYLRDNGLKKMFSVKQISPFSSSEFPIVIVGKSPLSAGLVRKQVPLLHPAA